MHQPTYFDFLNYEPEVKEIHQTYTINSYGSYYGVHSFIRPHLNIKRLKSKLVVDRPKVYKTMITIKFNYGHIISISNIKFHITQTYHITLYHLISHIYGDVYNTY